YSQEFLTMQSEFVQSEERFKRMTAEQTEYGTAKAIYESAKRKLQIVGLRDNEINTLADGHVPMAYLPVRAPFGGTLIAGEAKQGEAVQVGAEFFTIANLSKLWVIADVFEHDLPLVREGMQGDVVVAPYPSEKFPGRLTTIYDMVDSKSRTIKTRFDVENRQGKLKPEMFATVNVHALFGRRLDSLRGKSLKVPSLAVMDNKNEKYVFVAVNDTTFEQRSVKIGFETQLYTEILGGLKPGERVVTKGTFFLKSEMGKSMFTEE
ncbi:MAG: efflux RND transporter periplasmic adaptor subunit, partial [Ignavibacteriales bacterium]|nr:efflux RND transporter periplasmic adaptor subunit [Ignavibacteriales bacterium]